MEIRPIGTEGEESVVDVSGVIESFRVYAPPQQSPAMFRQVQVGEFSTDVVWPQWWRIASRQPGHSVRRRAGRRGDWN